MASIYWDIDTVFLENTIHDAGLFIRDYKKQWPYFRRHDFNWVSTFYSTPKNIAVFGVPKQVGQAKYIGTLLEDINRKKGSLGNTAVVLGDENLVSLRGKTGRCRRRAEGQGINNEASKIYHIRSIGVL